MGQISLCDGKYTVINDIDNGGGLRALVYGTEWRDLTGDSLVLALYRELEDAKAEVERLQEYNRHLSDKFFESGIEVAKLRDCCAVLFDALLVAMQYMPGEWDEECQRMEKEIREMLKIGGK